MRHHLHTSIFVAYLTVACSLCFGQDTPPTAPNGDTAMGIQIQLGGIIQNNGDHKSASFHRIIYKGKMLNQSGEEQKNTDPTHQFLSSGKSDSNDLMFDLVQGSGNVKNDILNGIGIDKLPIPKLFGPNYRSVLRGGGNLDGSSGNLAFGYETHALHVNGLSGWLIPGVNAERRWMKGTKPESLGTLNYRMFTGISNWGKIKRVPFALEDVIKSAPTWDRLHGFLATPPDTKNKDLFMFLIGQAKSLAFARDPGVGYAEKITHAYETQAKTYQLGLMDALWIEGDGWWDMVGQDHPRLKTFAAFVWTVFREMKTSGHTQFQVRYETGFDRSQPDRINRVMGTLGFVY